MTSPKKLRAAALDAAERGWSVFPLQPGGKKPALHGEADCTGSGACHEGHLGWEQRATTDLDRIERTWTLGRNNPASWNIGVATGPSGLLVVDTDAPKSGELPPQQWSGSTARHGEDSLAEWQSYYGELPPTYTVATAHGWHRYYEVPEVDEDGGLLRNSVDRLGWLIDTRAAGGYVVGAGSIVDGHEYRATSPDEAVAELPPAMGEQLLDQVNPQPSGLELPEDAARRDAYIRKAVQNEFARVLTSGPHQHNTALHQASANLGRLAHETGMPVDVLRGALQAAGEQVGQPPREAYGTIASGLRAGGVEVPRSTPVPQQNRADQPSRQPTQATPAAQSGRSVRVAATSQRDREPTASTTATSAAHRAGVAAQQEEAPAAEPAPSPASPNTASSGGAVVSGVRARAARARTGHAPTEYTGAAPEELATQPPATEPAERSLT